MKNTLPLLSLVLVVIVVLGSVTTKGTAFEGNCTPKGTFVSQALNPCPNLTKRDEWHIEWPDSSESHVLPNGTGWCSTGEVCCDSTPRTKECWPDFGSPVETNSSWSVRVTNKTTATTNTTCPNGCANANVVSCVSAGATTFAALHTCRSEEEGGSGGSEGCESDYECAFVGCLECNCVFGMCSSASPIVIDVSGNGFDLTSASLGVDFDLNGDGVARRVAWTTAGSDDVWLMLDRNANGKVDNGSELFGNITPQPISPNPNGFLALAVFDKPEHGGNGDGLITQSDAVFPLLRAWQDANHNGVSESSELRELRAAGILVLEIEYKESKRTDEFGNSFRYRAKVRSVQGAQIDRWAWDVFLVSAP
jgi:hypothetical protein